MANIEELLLEAGVRPTPNRILVFRSLLEAGVPLPLLELEARIATLERSSILRTLNVLTAAGLLHQMEDGRGVVNYELRSPRKGDAAPAGDSGEGHAHFYCEKCRRVVCLHGIPVPAFPLPEGYCLNSVNLMLKGVCPDCAR